MELRLSLFIAPFLLFWACASTEQASESSVVQPYNILWLVAEDQSPDFFPMYGDSTISLPALEAIAAESVIYDNAFANVPVCAPARSTIITGQYVIATGTHNMRTYNAYKKDNETSINVPSYTPVLDPEVMEFPKYIRAKGYYCTNNAKEDYNLKHTAGTWDDSSNNAHWRNRDKGQTFFSIFNFGKCHESGIWRFGKDSLFVDPTVVNVPPYFPNTDIVRHDLAVNYSNLKRIDDEIAEIISQLKADGLYDNTFIFFYGDHGGPFPRHKRSLYDSGIKVPLFVKLPKDLMSESYPQRNEDIVSFIDLAPTILSIAGIEKPSHMHGKAFLGEYLGTKDQYVYASSDRFDAVYDRKRTIRNKNFKYIRNYNPEIPYALPVVYREQMPMMKQLRELDQQGKLSGGAALWMRDEKEPEEFYDIVNDPYELNNLIGDKKYAEEIVIMQKALDKWITEMGDQGQYEEQELIEKWKGLRIANVLKAPLISISDNWITAINESQYGNIVYKKKNVEIWQVYSVPLSKEKGIVFKTVHIGLDDSEEVQSND